MSVERVSSATLAILACEDESGLGFDNERRRAVERLIARELAEYRAAAKAQRKLVDGWRVAPEPDERGVLHIQGIVKRDTRAACAHELDDTLPELDS